MGSVCDVANGDGEDGCCRVRRYGEELGRRRFVAKLSISISNES